MIEQREIIKHEDHKESHDLETHQDPLIQRDFLTVDDVTRYFGVVWVVLQNGGAE